MGQRAGNHGDEDEEGRNSCCDWENYGDGGKSQGTRSIDFLSTEDLSYGGWVRMRKG